MRAPWYRPFVALIVLVSASILAVHGLIAAEQAPLVRVTTSFDARHAASVLRAAAKPWSGGYGRSEADKIAHEIDAMRADQPRNWRYVVQYRGQPLALEIHAQLDDLGMIDLDFATAPEAAPALRAAVDGYLNTHGR